MKQTIFMVVLTLVGTVGVLFGGPFIAISIYWLFAVLRPQWLWRWAMPPNIGWSEYVAVAVIIATVGYTLRRSAEQTPGPKRFAFAHGAFLVFTVWLVVTYVTALNTEVAGKWLMEYLKILAMIGVAAVVVTEQRQIWILYVITTGSLIYIAYELNFLYVTAGRLDIYRSGYGGLDNNGAGLMIAMGLPLAIYAWEATPRWWRWIFAVGVPLILHSVLMSYSRGAMVAVLAASPLILLRSRRRWQFSAMALAIAIMVPILAGKEIRERFFTVENYETDKTANSRFESWQAAIRIANDHPIFGVGIRNANLLSRGYGADMENRAIHSQYLQTLADNGYPGLVLYLITLCSVWIAIERARRALRTRTDPEAHQLRSMVAGLEGSLAVFCVGASFLSLEVFELPYLVALLGIQAWVITRGHMASPVEAIPPKVTAPPTFPSRLRDDRAGAALATRRLS